jgi:MFS family permease
VAHCTVAETRGDIFAWYSLTGQAGTSFGIFLCGWIIRILVQSYGWDHLRCYRLIFYLYAATGLLKVWLAVLLSSKVEAEQRRQQRRGRLGRSEHTPLLIEADGPNPGLELKSTGRFKRLLPAMERESIRIVISLSVLCAVDAFATGLVSL